MIAPIQYLRAVAALMVVWSHACDQMSVFQDSISYELGHLGVDVFFVISGVIMTLTPQETTPLQFMRRRIVRLVPLYWAMTLAVAVAALVAPSLFRGTVVEPLHLVKSLLFIPHENPGRAGEWWPLLVPGWTLNYEMFFYAVFAISLVTGRWFVITVLGGLLLLGLTEPIDPLAKFFTDARLAGFLLGALIGWYAPRHPGRYAAAACACLGLCLIVWLREGFAATAGCALIVWASLALTLRSKLLESLGDASYSIYLTHAFTLGALRTVWARLDADPVFFAPVAVVLSAAAGWVVYRTAERPLHIRLRRPRMAAA